MKSLFKTTILFLVACVIVLSSCSKKSDDPQPENTEPYKSKLVEREQVIQIPTAFANNNTNRYAVETRGYITSTNTIFSAYSNLLFIPTNATNSGNGNWTWRDLQGNEVTYTTSLAGGEYKVIMEVKPAGGTAYKVFEATEKQDGTCGKITWLDESGTAVAVMEWKYENGVFTSTIVSGNQRIVSESNDNLSGTIKVYEDGVLLFNAEWQSSGSGECTSYNNDGTQNETGDW